MKYILGLYALWLATFHPHFSILGLIWGFIPFQGALYMMMYMFLLLEIHWNVVAWFLSNSFLPSTVLTFWRSTTRTIPLALWLLSLWCLLLPSLLYILCDLYWLLSSLFGLSLLPFSTSKSANLLIETFKFWSFNIEFNDFVVALFLSTKRSSTHSNQIIIERNE